MAYDLRHTGEAIDAAVYAVERGSVVTENTAKEVALGEAKPASADAIAKELQKKVDKEPGKGLSTNDYTDEEKNRVAQIEGKQDTLKMTVKDNGNIVIGNIAGQTKEFMPATPSGDPMHYAYVAEGAVYDTSKNRWLLNGLELTNEDMGVVYARTKDFAKQMTSADSRLPNVASDLYRNGDFKTNLVGGNPSLMYSINPSWKNMFRNNFKLVTINPVCGSDGVYLLEVVDLNTAFEGCVKFKSILYPIKVSKIDTDHKMANAFSACFELENVKLKGLKVSLSFKSSPNVSLEMLQYIVENAANTSAITITVHSEVYNKLVDTTNTAWNALNTLASTKNIAFAIA